MRRRFSMFSICGSRSAKSDDEDNKITDGLEQCLSVDKGLKSFQTFLERNQLVNELATFKFYLKCGSILTEVSRHSPTWRNKMFSDKLDKDAHLLYEMAGDVNFDQRQMELLESTFINGTDQEKIDRISEAQQWSVDLLHHIYDTFRTDFLNSSKR